MLDRLGNSGIPTGVLVDTGGYHTDEYGAFEFSFDIQHAKYVDHSWYAGMNIPSFRAKRREGKLLPFTPWQKFVVTGETDGDRTNTIIAHPLEKDLYTNFWSGKSGWIIEDHELKAKAQEYSNYMGTYVGAAASKIYSQGHDTLTFIAELGKTVKLFRNTVNRLVKLAGKGELAKLWLEGRYGWRLVIYDMIDIAEAIATLDDRRTRLKDRVGDSWEDTTIVDISSSNTWEDWSGSIVTDYKTSVRGSIVADISPPKFAFNPVTTAWELVPYSFVVDWFVNVGQFLESMSFLALQSKYYAAGGVIVEADRVLSVTGQHAATNTTYTSSSWQESTCRATWTERVPLEVPNQPSLQIRLDAYKVTDLTALLIELLL